MKSQAARQYLEERYESIRRRKPADRGIPCFGDLTQEERETVVGHLIASEPAEAVREVLGEADTLTLGVAIGRAFASKSRASKEVFWELLGKDVTQRYEKTIDALFESIHEEALLDAQFNPPYDKDEDYYQLLKAA